MTSSHITSHPIPTNNTSPCVSHSFLLSSWTDSAGPKKKKKAPLKRVGTYSRPTNLHATCQGCVRLANHAECCDWGNPKSTVKIVSMWHSPMITCLPLWMWPYLALPSHEVGIFFWSELDGPKQKCFGSQYFFTQLLIERNLHNIYKKKWVNFSLSGPVATLLVARMYIDPSCIVFAWLF